MPYIEPLYHNNGQISEELLSLHMNFVPRGGYVQLKDHYIGLQKCYGPWPRIPWFKSCRALYGAPISQ